MTRNSDMRYLIAIFAILPLLAIWGIWDGWQYLFLKGIAFNYVWPSMMLLAMVEILVCYLTDSVKATTIGALIMAAAFVLMIDWPVVVANPGDWEIGCGVASALTMAVALLSFAFIWLKFNEFIIPNNVKWIPMVFAIAACVIPIFATSAAIEGGRSTLFQISYLGVTWTIIYEMTRDLAGDKADFLYDNLSFFSMGQWLIIVIACPLIELQESGWGLMTFISVSSCVWLADFANGGHIEGAFFDGVKKIAKQPDLLIMFVAQLVELACAFWICFDHDFSMADASLASEIVWWAAIIAAGFACIRLNQMYRAKKKLS